MEGTERSISTAEAAEVFTDGGASRSMVAELDHQVATAKRYPRSITEFMRHVETVATVNERVAADCLYALPRKDARGGVKTITGPSVRMAEIVFSAWGNCRVAGRVLDDSGDYVTAQGVFHDLERNVAISVEVRRRITDRNGRRFNPDMVNTTANAAVSVAIRNSILRGVPRTYWDGGLELARRVLAGDAATLSARRLTALDYWSKLGIPNDRLYATLGVKGLEDITADMLVSLRAMATAVRDGELDLDDAFPRPKEDNPAPASSGVAGVKAAVMGAQAVPVTDAMPADGTVALAMTNPPAAGEESTEPAKARRGKGTTA